MQVEFPSAKNPFYVRIPSYSLFEYRSWQPISGARIRVVSPPSATILFISGEQRADDIMVDMSLGREYWSGSVIYREIQLGKSHTLDKIHLARDFDGQKNRLYVLVDRI